MTSLHPNSQLNRVPSVSCSHRFSRSISTTGVTPPGSLNIRSFPRKGCKTLFLGEGNFSFAVSWLSKHMQELRDQGKENEASDLPKTVIATEYQTRSACEEDPFTEANIKKLENLGTLVLFGVDGRRIDTNDDLKDFNITRVRINCPDVDEGFCDADGKLPDDIQLIASAAYRTLPHGGTLEFVLLAPPRNWKTWQGAHYGITRVEEEGFYLNRGRVLKSGQFEYPGYIHNKTCGAADGKTVAVAQLDIMSKAVFVKDEFQRTPPSYLGRVWTCRRQYFPGQKGYRETEHGYYPFYLAKPGEPCSPTIEPPSFFLTHPNPWRAQPPRAQPLDSIPENDEEFLVDIDEQVSDGIEDLDAQDFLTSKQRRRSLGTLCRSVSKVFNSRKRAKGF